MRGDATITVEIAVKGIDLPGLNAFVEYVAEDHGLTRALHSNVNATPGVGAKVTNVAWRPPRGDE